MNKYIRTKRKDHSNFKKRVLKIKRSGERKKWFCRMNAQVKAIRIIEKHSVDIFNYDFEKGW